MAIDLKKLKKPKVHEEGLKVLELLSSEDATVKSISTAISNDPVLTASMIRYANAPIYRRMVEVTNVKNAINILGMKNVRLAVLVATMSSVGSKESYVKDLIWEHCYAVSNIAKMIATKVCRRIADNIELTALMHDMGVLVLSANFPEEYDKLARQAVENRAPIEALEKEFFGFSHDEVLTAIAGDLRLPDDTRTALDGFHTREPIYEVKTDIDYHVAIVSLAHILEKDIYSERGHLQETIPESLESLQVCLSLTTDDLQDITESYENIINEKYA